MNPFMTFEWFVFGVVALFTAAYYSAVHVAGLLVQINKKQKEDRTSAAHRGRDEELAD